MQEIEVVSTLDGSVEPSLFSLPETDGKIPLVVGLHTWSADRFNQVDRMLPHTEKLGWALLLPEFRGANLVSNPRAREACGSRLAKQDIIDAVEHVCARFDALDREQIYLVGGSGGGHMALMMAAYRPKLWRQVSSWCPITDLSAWHGENQHYTPHIVACCGGAPEDAAEDYQARSPITHLEDLANAYVRIHHGKWDPSVPFTHSLKLYNELYARFPDANVYLSIFDGGHDFYLERAFQDFQRTCEAGAKELTA